MGSNTDWIDCGRYVAAVKCRTTSELSHTWRSGDWFNPCVERTCVKVASNTFERAVHSNFEAIQLNRRDLHFKQKTSEVESR